MKIKFTSFPKIDSKAKFVSQCIINGHETHREKISYKFVRMDRDKLVQTARPMKKQTSNSEPRAGDKLEAIAPTSARRPASLLSSESRCAASSWRSGFGSSVPLTSARSLCAFSNDDFNWLRSLKINKWHIFY